MHSAGHLASCKETTSTIFELSGGAAGLVALPGNHGRKLPAEGWPLHCQPIPPTLTSSEDPHKICWVIICHVGRIVILQNDSAIAKLKGFVYLDVHGTL